MNLIFLSLFLSATFSFAHSIHYIEDIPLRPQSVGHESLYEMEGEITEEFLKKTPLEIVKVGSDSEYILRQRAIEVDLENLKKKKVQEFISDMFITMKIAGGVGLAAPQVGRGTRIFVMKHDKRDITVINPTIIYDEASGKKRSFEGCLSFPRWRNKVVSRYKKVHLEFYNRTGKQETNVYTGFQAVVVQHEYDHLEGILMTDY